MKLDKRCAAALLPLVLAACDGIGEGNGPVSMEIVFDGDAEAGEAFECLAATPQAVVTFDNGSRANFARRAQWSSSDESVFRVSNGEIEAADGEFFVTGAVLPVGTGTAELSVRYLSFEDSITVTVQPTRIELSPHDRTVIQGNQLSMRSTGILQGARGTSALDMSGLGRWSVTAADGGEALSFIVSGSGLLTAGENVAGTDRVTFTVGFCERSLSVDVAIANQSLQAVRLARADAPDTALDGVALPPDASIRLQAIGEYSGGLERDLTSAVSLDIGDADVAYSGVRGVGVVSSFFDVPGQSTEITATFDPDSGVEGDELISNTVSIQVLDVTLNPETLAVRPAEAVMLNGSSLQFGASGRFSGNDGELDWDLTRDVTWSSSNADILLLSNTIGSKGFGISSGNLADLGEILVSATRQLGDGPEEAPVGTITVGAASADDAPLEVVGLTISAPADSVRRGEPMRLSAEAELASETLSGTQDLTQLLIWRSSDEAVAVVDNSSSARGTVTVLTDAPDQSVTITGLYSDTNQEADVEGSITLTVNPSAAE